MSHDDCELMLDTLLGTLGIWTCHLNSCLEHDPGCTICAKSTRSAEGEKFYLSIQPAFAHEDASWLKAEAKSRMAARQWQPAFWSFCHTKDCMVMSASRSNDRDWQQMWENVSNQKQSAFHLPMPGSCTKCSGAQQMYRAKLFYRIPHVEITRLQCLYIICSRHQTTLAPSANGFPAGHAQWAANGTRCNISKSSALSQCPPQTTIVTLIIAGLLGCRAPA